MSASTARQPALGFIFVTLVLAMLGGGLVIPVLPGLVTQFEGGDIAEGSHWYAWIIGAFALMQFIGSPIIGALSDRYGRRRVLLIALAGSSIDYVIMALAPNVGWLLVARMISGLTAAVLPTANAYVADVTPPEKRAHAFGLLGAAFGLGFVLGPVIGGLLGQFSLRLPFWAAAGFAMLNFCYGAFVLPESLKPENRRAFDWRRANPFSALLALRRFPAVLGLAGTHLIFWLAQTLLHATWVLYMGYRFHWSTGQIGGSFALVGVCSALVQAVLVKRLLPSLGERRAVAIGFTLAIVAYLAYGLSTQGWMIYATIVFASLSGIAGPALQSYISRHVPANEQGSVQGAFASLTSVAYVIGLPAGAWSFAAAVAPGSVWPVGIAFFESTVLMVLALALAMRSFRRDGAPAPLPTS
jgi:DHA1 family tetracycline resistance protein-like MFS transporter